MFASKRVLQRLDVRKSPIRFQMLEHAGASSLRPLKNGDSTVVLQDIQGVTGQNVKPLTQLLGKGYLPSRTEDGRDVSALQFV